MGYFNAEGKKGRPDKKFNRGGWVCPHIQISTGTLCMGVPQWFENAKHRISLTLTIPPCVTKIQRQREVIIQDSPIVMVALVWEAHGPLPKRAKYQRRIAPVRIIVEIYTGEGRALTTSTRSSSNALSENCRCPAVKKTPRSSWSEVTANDGNPDPLTRIECHRKGS
jgi:hypothetical protein